MGRGLGERQKFILVTALSFQNKGMLMPRGIVIDRYLRSLRPDNLYQTRKNFSAVLSRLLRRGFMFQRRDGLALSDRGIAEARRFAVYPKPKRPVGRPPGSKNKQPRRKLEKEKSI